MVSNYRWTKIERYYHIFLSSFFRYQDAVGWYFHNERRVRCRFHLVLMGVVKYFEREIFQTTMNQITRASIEQPVTLSQCWIQMHELNAKVLTTLHIMLYFHYPC